MSDHWKTPFSLWRLMIVLATFCLLFGLGRIGGAAGVAAAGCAGIGLAILIFHWPVSFPVTAGYLCGVAANSAVVFDTLGILMLPSGTLVRPGGISCIVTLNTIIVGSFLSIQGIRPEVTNHRRLAWTALAINWTPLPLYFALLNLAAYLSGAVFTE